MFYQVTKVGSFFPADSKLLGALISLIFYQASDVSGSVCIPQIFTYRGTYSNFYIKHEHVEVSSLSKKPFFEGLLEKQANTTRSLLNFYDSHINLSVFCMCFRRDV